MKNVIMYYYNLNNINIYKINDRNYVKYKNEIYLFQPVINERETIEIYNLLKNNSKFYRIILNKDKTIFTPYKGTKFVLQKIFSNKIELIYNPIKYFQVINSKTTLDRTNWIYLWQIKIDYYEYQLKHISGKYPIIDESINYFIGMAETAISYIKYNCKKIEYNDDVTFCRRRINKEDFYNPLNIIIDYKERDIGEYLKYIFGIMNINILIWIKL